MFSIGKDINKAKDTLAKDFGIVTNWFYENFMVSNFKNFYFMCIGRGGENETLTFKGACHKNSKKEVISGITMITNLILK